jgi:hypothetical protein
MNLWARLKAWWGARKVGQQTIDARRQQARAETILAGTLTLGGHGEFTGSYHSPSGADCGPGVSGDCSGTAV